MAGLYDDAPSRRMAFDDDGTVGVRWNSGSSSIAITPTELAHLNRESTGGPVGDWHPSNTPYWVVFLYPEAREIDGYFLADHDGILGTNSFQSSGDSTSGQDGTWGTVTANVTWWANTYPTYRDEIVSTAEASKVATRLQMGVDADASAEIESIHIYGTISPGQTPDRILFLDTANSDAEFSKVLDYGEVPRGQTQTRTIKIKNNSSTKTINTLQLTAEDLYLNAGAFYTFSLDDVSYQATLNTIGNLSPGATKLIYVKQSVPDAETLGVQTGRLRIAHASLT